MDQKEVIAQKIIEDATLRAQKSIDEANLLASELVIEAQKQANEQIENAKVVAKEEGEKLIERRNTIARLDAKQQILVAKQALINQVFERAKTLLEGMDKSDYLALLVKQIEKYAESGDKILLSAKAPLSKEELEQTPVCQRLGLLVEKQGNFSGGIIIVGAKKDMDLTFTSIVKSQQEELAGEIARKLFGENE